jgi:hypothetical protein
MKKKLMILAFLLLPFTAYTENIKGVFKATEVEPILVWEYVSQTCNRSESSCQTICDGYGENCGQQCTSYDVPYECGSDQWVRRGSKPIFDLEVEYSIDLKNVSPGLDTNLKMTELEIDTGFSKESFIRKFFKFSSPSVNFYTTNIVLNEIAKTDQSKSLQIFVTANLIDPIKVNKTLVNETLFKSKSNLKLAENLPLDAIELEICVGQDRALTRNTRNLGCQKVNSKNIVLNEIFFNQARSNRKLVYFFNWKMKGEAIMTSWHTSPFIMPFKD